MATNIAQGAKIILGIWIAGVIYAMFLVVPQYVGLGDAGRIIIVHVPVAWVTTACYAVSAWYSIQYLRNRRIGDDMGAVAAAEVGTLYCIFATVTGSIFAEVVWGTFWNWDPRETSILVLLLIYAAYFALRSSVDDGERRRRLAAVYNLFAAVTMPFLLFIAPRVADSTLHPNCAFLQGSKCEGIYLDINGAKIGQLGDVVVELKALQTVNDLSVATVEVRMPGLQDIATLQPSLDAEGKAADRPEFPGEQFRMILLEADVAAGTVRVNMQAPGTGLLSNPRTLWVFMAGNIGFAGLAAWLFAIRKRVLVLQTRITPWEASV
ncbi:MAG: cytochrome c biogenesis protein [Roseiflexaceae bacterium]|jgi:heme exporter protein C|nr:cytochrome c biogenesis protein CcsA [Chloroflexaceae bacterium]